MVKGVVGGSDVVKHLLHLRRLLPLVIGVYRLLLVIHTIGTIGTIPIIITTSLISDTH